MTLEVEITEGLIGGITKCKLLLKVFFWVLGFRKCR